MKNIITVPVIERSLNVRFPPVIRGQLIKATPKEVPDGYLALPVASVSLAALRRIAVKKGVRVFWSETGGWFENESWFTEVMEPRWIVVQKEARKETANRTYDRQVEFAKPGEQIATAQEVIYATTINFIVNGDRMLEDYYVRTSTSSDGILVSFGRLDTGGAIVNRWKPRLADSDMLSLFARSLESLNSEPLNLEPPLAVQASVVVNGVEYKGELKRA